MNRFFFACFLLALPAMAFGQCCESYCCEFCEATTPHCPPLSLCEDCFGGTTTPGCPPADKCDECYGCEECPTCEPCGDPTEEPTEAPTTTEPGCSCPTCPSVATPKTPPKFTQIFYRTTLSSWPPAGTIVDLGISARVSDPQDIIRYELLTSADFARVTSDGSILFTQDVSKGKSGIGPNDIFVAEVVAYIMGDKGRKASATVVVAFPEN